MKKQNILMILMIILLSFSCSRKITKRKGCKGKGHWYGNRNLSIVEPINGLDKKNICLLKNS